ncbi:RNA-directed DNA polymerase, eukaryota [Tanacetum coccineum]
MEARLKFNEAQNKISDIELAAESRDLKEDETECLSNDYKAIYELEKLKMKDLKQKAKLKWAVDGDENTKFFHGIINNNYQRQKIKGIYYNGQWISKPSSIKGKAFEIFSNKFSEDMLTRPPFKSDQFLKVYELQRETLECPFLKEEIKNSVWRYGGDKAPGPDGFTFGFIKKYWDIIGDDITNVVIHFHSSAFIPKGGNSSFITLIKKIKDPITLAYFRPICLLGCYYKILASVLAKRLKMVILSIISDVQMAYVEGINILEGPRIINEVKACLESAHTSILINGNPTKEFRFQKGIRQGDPLSPFLFIIAVEALHVALLEAKEKNIFKRITLGQNNTSLKLNYEKSRLFGVGVTFREVDALASSLKCIHGEEGSLNLIELSSIKKGTWGQIIRCRHWASKHGICISSLFRYKLGNEERIRFWKDLWCGSQPLQVRFPRLFALEEIKDHRVNNIVEHILTGQIDICNWRRTPKGGREEEELINLRSELEGANFSNQVDCLQWPKTDSGIYTVKSLRNALDNLILPSNGDEFKWNKLILIKVNILFWQVSLNRIPTRLNLQNKGIICPSVLCPLCDLEAENIQHLFYQCSLANTLWSKVMEW